MNINNLKVVLLIRITIINIFKMADTTVFDKILKKTSGEIKSRIQKMISEGSAFCCTNMNISVEIPDNSPEAEPGDKLTIYCTKEQMENWLNTLFNEELKTKPLNPMALEQMAKKGIQPKKQPREIMLIIIVPSNKRVHIGVSVPEGMNINIDEFIKNSFQNNVINVSGDGFEMKYNVNKIDDKLVYIDYETDSEVKEIDNALAMFFKQLKKDGIYVDEESDGEYVDYLEGME